MKLPTKKKQAFNPTRSHEDYLCKIEESVEKKGVVFLDPEADNLHIDRGFLSLPLDITLLSSQDLGNTLSAFTQYKMFLRTTLVRAENLLEATGRAYRDISSALYEEYTKKKYSETSKERLIRSNEEIKPYFEDYSDCRRQIAMIESAIANSEDAIFLLSREVTRRGADYNEENREYNVGRK